MRALPVDALAAGAMLEIIVVRHNALGHPGCRRAFFDRDEPQVAVQTQRERLHRVRKRIAHGNRTQLKLGLQRVDETAARDVAALEELAIAGAAALNGEAASAVTFIDSKTVADAFAKGAVLSGAANGENYMVHASRREKSGLSEVHDLDTDLIYVVDGTATIVTGGKSVDPKTIEPNEHRGTSIDGGETRQLKKGDVLIVPKGTPHWFKQVDGTFLYYVVKVR